MRVSEQYSISESAADIKNETKLLAILRSYKIYKYKSARSDIIPRCQYVTCTSVT